MKYESIIIRNLVKWIEVNPFYHLTGSQAEIEYLQENNCQVRFMTVYGGEIATIVDKETGEAVDLPVYRED